MIGKTISHYKIIEKLGEGGMGEVYKAEDTKLKRTVALKFLPAAMTNDPEANARFIQEAQAASALDHPNICTIYEINQTEDGRTYIAMGYYSGQTLDEKIEGGPLPREEAINITLQIAQGLARAHEESIVHRDIKPANIVITDRGEVKIIDFGLAKLAGISKLTKEGSTVGTLAYSSPEQIQGKELDHRSDIWSLGVILYEMLTGKLPFEGDYDSALLYSIVNTEHIPLSNYAEQIPVELEHIIAKCLSKNKAKRYQSVDDMVSELKSLQSTTGSGASTIPSVAESAKNKSGLYLYGGLAAAVALIVTAALLFWPQPEPTQSKGNESDVSESEQTLEDRKAKVTTSNKSDVTEPEQPSQVIETQRAKSIAVLSFVDLSPQEDQGYFCDGVSEEILNKLAKIRGLKVAARTSSFKFKGSAIDISEIGKQLNVATVLDGSVRKSGEKVRITAQLINVSDGFHIWSESYDKELKDIFSVQDEIALDIVNALKIELGVEEENQLKKRYTENLRAHDLYQRGRFFWNLRSEEGFNKAIDYFEQAIVEAPDFALAYAGLADVYVVLPYWVTANHKEYYQKAREAVSKALELDDLLAEAYAALGMISMEYERNYTAAETAFKLAIELNPNFATGHQWYGEFLSRMSRFDESLSQLEKALELDSLSFIVNVMYSYHFVFVGDYERAISLATKALELLPDNPQTLFLLASMYVYQGDSVNAFETLKKMLISSNATRQEITEFERNYATEGMTGVWRYLIDFWIGNPMGDYFIAACYAALDEKDQAFSVLQGMEEGYDPRLFFVNIEPIWDNLRSDPRYHELMKKIGLEK